MTYEFAGSIKAGKKVVVQAKLQGSFDVRPGDPCDRYITMINSHDGSTGLKAFFTPIRLFCMNQLQAALKGAISSVSLRHTVNASQRMHDAMQVFGLSENYFEHFKERAAFLDNKIVDAQMVGRFLDEVVGNTGSTKNSNHRNEVTRLFEQGKGNGQGSAYDLYNGLTEFVDHSKISDDEKRYESALVGAGARMKQAAWEVALSL